jgi:hypothetical protein
LTSPRFAPARDVPLLFAAGLHQGSHGAVSLLQEQAFGGLDPKTAKYLDGRARGDKRGADRPRRLKPRTVLLREYQGERHTVTVVPNGYVWRETTYASLSTIARDITGTAWSGPPLLWAARRWQSFEGYRA